MIGADPGLLLWTFGLWGVLVVAAILNAGLRQKVLIPHMGGTLGRAASSVTLSLAILLVAYLFFALSNIERSTIDLWAMGVIWLSLTVMFEFGFGRFVMKHSWRALLADYNVLKGRIWVLVLIASLTGPFLMGSIVG